MYKILIEGGSGEIEEKKSRFIATLRPVETQENRGIYRGNKKEILGCKTQLFCICTGR